MTVSSAENVWTAVEFSFIDLELVEEPFPPEGPVILGPTSSKFATLTVRVWSEALPAESVALTFTS